MLIYIGAVVATQLFGDTDADHFGSLSASLRSMFQITTGDDWAAVIAPTADVHPWSYVFFVVYIVLSTYIVLNLFIAVAVEALDRQEDEDRDELRHEVDEVEQAVDESSTAILAALADLKEPGGRARGRGSPSAEPGPRGRRPHLRRDLPRRAARQDVPRHAGAGHPYRPILVWLGVGAAFAVQTAVAVLLGAGGVLPAGPRGPGRRGRAVPDRRGAAASARRGRTSGRTSRAEDDDAGRSTPPRQRPRTGSGPSWRRSSCCSPPSGATSRSC